MPRTWARQLGLGCSRGIDRRRCVGCGSGRCGRGALLLLGGLRLIVGGAVRGAVGGGGRGGPLLLLALAHRALRNSGLLGGSRGAAASLANAKGARGQPAGTPQRPAPRCAPANPFSSTARSCSEREVAATALFAARLLQPTAGSSDRLPSLGTGNDALLVARARECKREKVPHGDTLRAVVPRPTPPSLHRLACPAALRAQCGYSAVGG